MMLLKRPVLIFSQQNDAPLAFNSGLFEYRPQHAHQ